MDTQRKVKLQVLESLEELEILIRGDAITIVDGRKEYSGAYHGKSHTN